MTLKFQSKKKQAIFTLEKLKFCIWIIFLEFSKKFEKKINFWKVYKRTRL